MHSDLQLVYMVSRNSTQMLNINTTKFQVELEPVYVLVYILIAFFFHTEIMISAAHMLGGMLPCEFFFKMCNLMRLGEYFDQILY